jgi:hypothetical protein
MISACRGTLSDDPHPARCRILRSAWKRARCKPRHVSKRACKARHLLKQSAVTEYAAPPPGCGDASFGPEALVAIRVRFDAC